MSVLVGLLTNPVFAGGAGVAGMSALMWIARSLPQLMKRALERQCSVTLVIDNADDLFSRLSIYFSRSHEVQRARWLRMAEQYDWQTQRWCWRATFGLGFHVIRDSGSWYFVWRALDEKAGGMALTRRETMTIRTFGRSQAAIIALMGRAEAVHRDQPGVRVHVWHQGGWILTDMKAPRSFDTLFLPASQKRRIIADHDSWAMSRAEYRHRGTPWRRGYLFRGPPGTGKTSLALALASHGCRPLYAINLATAGGDTGLLAAFNSAEPGALILLEDIDGTRIAHDRLEVEATPAAIPAPERHVSLSGLLNVIDGLPAREDRVLVMTSNHADKLDPALVRPGRIDLIEEIGPIERKEAWEMARFVVGECAPWFETFVVPRLPITPALLQGMLLELAAQAKPEQCQRLAA